MGEHRSERRAPEDEAWQGQFEALRHLVYRRTGMVLGDQKRSTVLRHMHDRMHALELNRGERYVNYLRFFDPGGEEFQALVNRVTVNETYFFRDFPQLQTFAEGCLPELAARARQVGRHRLRVLSAGCASGEEPYTLAIILLEMLEDDPMPFDVVAVDIDDGVLAQARRGRYDRRSVKDVPKLYLERYFDRSVEHYALRDIVKRRVNFVHGNLADPQAMEKLGGGFDAVFCRNVLIYFDDASRREVVERFYDLLQAGGYIFLGHSEPLSRISDLFRMRRSRSLVLYQKPGFGREKP